MMNYRNTAAKAARQRGAVLLVSLIMLLILTLLGVSSMDTSLLELKMTNNFQQQVQAMNEAEQNLLVGEMDVEALVNNPQRFNFNTADDGYYNSSTDMEDVRDWSSLSVIPGAGTDQGYVVEYLGTKNLPGNSIALDPDGGTPGDSVHAYVISARSKVGKGAQRTVQSSYTTFAAP
jgi:type IV pilus assembly protein PilX